MPCHATPHDESVSCGDPSDNNAGQPPRRAAAQPLSSPLSEGGRQVYSDNLKTFIAVKLSP